MTSDTIRLSERRATAPARISYLARLIDVLEAVGTSRDALPGLSEIAQQTGIPLSTASRLIALLSERGFVRRLPGGRYGLGAGLYKIALHGLSGLADLEGLEAAVRRLARETGESASAGLLLDDEIVLVARRESEHRLRLAARVGDRVEPHLSAMGKAVLAHLEAGRRLEVLGAVVGTDAETVLALLAPELERVRREGFARDEETYAPGLRCRAAPIFGLDGRALGAISVAGPASRFTLEAADAAMPQLLAETAAISFTPDTAA